MAGGVCLPLVVMMSFMGRSFHDAKRVTTATEGDAPVDCGRFCFIPTWERGDWSPFAIPSELKLEHVACPECVGCTDITNVSV